MREQSLKRMEERDDEDDDEESEEEEYDDESSSLQSTPDKKPTFTAEEAKITHKKLSNNTATPMTEEYKQLPIKKAQSADVASVTTSPSKKKVMVPIKTTQSPVRGASKIGSASHSPSDSSSK